MKSPRFKHATHIIVSGSLAESISCLYYTKTRASKRPLGADPILYSVEPPFL